MRYRA
jgi:ATP-binding cassette subfamily C (CFTR/MRP) protein 4